MKKTVQQQFELFDSSATGNGRITGDRTRKTSADNDKARKVRRLYTNYLKNVFDYWSIIGRNFHIDPGQKNL
jgi:hypothetical protein